MNSRRWLGAIYAAAAAFVAVPSHAVDTFEEIMRRGNEAFLSRDHDAAIAEYDKLLDAGVRDPDVYFNLGTIHASKREYGAAILYYERALRWRPDDEDASRGIDAAYDALGRARASLVGEATVRPDPPATEALVSAFTEDGLAWAFLVLTFLCFGGWIARILISPEHHTTRLVLTIAIPVLGFLAALNGAGLAAKAEWFSDGHSGLVIAERPVLRAGPDRRAASRGEIHEGDRIRVLDQRNGWSRIRVTELGEGFVPSDEVATIRD